MVTRRHVVLNVTASAFAASAPALAMGQTPSKRIPEAMTHSFVLVHGAWHGGWCWRFVAQALRQAGHRVFTPTLTGMGARHHLARRDTDLNTHIEDVRQVLKYEELEDVILVGHSYGGAVVEGVFDLVPDQIAKVIMLDASIMEDGDSMLAGAPAELIAQTEANLVDGYMLPTWPPEAFGVFPSDGEVYPWLQRRLTSMPYKALTTALQRTNTPLEGPDTLYISCIQPQMQGAERNFDKAKARGWTIKTLAAGHDAMVTAPAALTEMLIDAA